MSNVTPIPPLPLPDDDEAATREVNGGEVLDEDVNDDLVDSAAADEVASQSAERDD